MVEIPQLYIDCNLESLSRMMICHFQGVLFVLASIYPNGSRFNDFTYKSMGHENKTY